MIVMATITLLPLSLLIIHMLGIANSAIITDPNMNPNPNTNLTPTITDFIKSSCEGTRYPVTCVESLSGNASEIGNSEQQLAITALSVSMSTAQSLASSIKEMSPTTGIKPMENNAVRDCIENIDDSVERLTQSITELGLAGKPNGKDSLHISNVQTWVSAAITAQDTCLEGLNGPNMDAKLKADISHRIVDVSEHTSNALALVNLYASKILKQIHN